MSNHTDDTIVAIATSLGEGGIAIVRVSGPDCFNIADEIFHCSGRQASERVHQTFVYGHVTDSAVQIDEALLLIMRAPHTYTREDMIEIQGHGGSVCAQRILRRVLDAGARLAEPGEFTRRAFLNGRLDLVQAEAVLDLVHARSERAAQAALEQLDGSLSSRFNSIYDQLLHVAADCEATLDFPEDDLPADILNQIPARLQDVESNINRLISLWDEGHLLRDGALVVISGLPNVGKSTLLNALLDTDRAIVSHMPGTTRDTIEESLILDGIPLKLVDTAGLRPTDCEIEREGIERTQRQMNKANLHLYIVDASRPLKQNDVDRLSNLTPETAIVILNKIDLGQEIQAADTPDFTVVETCLTERRGLESLRDAMRAKIESGLDLATPPHAVISERHRRLLIHARGELQDAIDMLKGGRQDEVVLAAVRLRAALESIGTATGRVYEDDLLANIFSRFCIGK